MFDLDGYKDLLTSFLSSEYEFRLFGEEWCEYGSVYLRHDLDFCVDYALPIALIEKDMNIRSTFFVLFNSNLYNLCDANSLKTLEELSKMGHKICLHVDEQTINSREDFVRQMTAFVNVVSYADSKFISRHRPKFDTPQMWLPDECIDVYDNLYFKQIEYASDSRGEWKYGYPTERKAFLEKKSFQLLTHPLWWVHNGTLSNSEKIQVFLKKKQEETQNSLSFLNFNYNIKGESL